MSEEVFVRTELQQSLDNCLSRIINAKSEEEQIIEITLSPMLFDYIKNPSEEVISKYIELKLSS